uniref:Fasciclin 2 n=1 Tax=Strigamia maritima TaxID=126957 RepID=T1J3N7_STRMM
MKPYKSTDRCKIESDGIMCQPITQQDEGQYVCRARVSSTGRMDAKSIRVIVDIPPKIDSLDPEYNTIEDESITITCTATGKPVPTVKWLNKDGMDLSTQPGYNVDEISGELTIDKVGREHHGSFKCVVENGAGSDQRETRINVVRKPKIKQFYNVTAEKEGEAKLICRVSAEPTAEITITKKSSQRVFEINQQYDERIIVSLTDDEDDQVLTITIKEVMDEDDGLYVCSARNGGTAINALGHLTVEFSPVFDLMSHTPIKSWERNIVNLTCIARSIPNASIEWYSPSKDIIRDPNIERSGAGPVSTLSVRTMDNTYYIEYRCKATNKLGMKEAYMRIEQAFVPKNIRQVDFMTVTATTVTFYIMGPEDTGGLPITHYFVQYTDEKGDVKIRQWPVAGKRYNFEFAAANAVGTGPYGLLKERVMPKKDVPEEPHIDLPTNTSRAVSDYSDRMEISWQSPPDNGETIDHFSISYYPLEVREGAYQKAGELVTKTERFPNTKVLLRSLQPNTFYRVEVRAHNILGYSRPAQVVIKTLHGTVSDQQQMKVADVSLGFILGIVAAVCLVLLIVIDISCYYVNKCGLLMCLCTQVCGREHPGDKSKHGKVELGLDSEKENGGKEVKVEPYNGLNGEVNDSKADDELSLTKAEEEKLKKEPQESTPMINGDKEKEFLKESMDNDSIKNKSQLGSKSNIIAKDSPV